MNSQGSRSQQQQDIKDQSPIQPIKSDGIFTKLQNQFTKQINMHLVENELIDQVKGNLEYLRLCADKLKAASE